VSLVEITTVVSLVEIALDVICATGCLPRGSSPLIVVTLVVGATRKDIEIASDVAEELDIGLAERRCGGARVGRRQKKIAGPHRATEAHEGTKRASIYDYAARFLSRGLVENEFQKSINCSVRRG
jgi:hypothetical protein